MRVAAVQMTASRDKDANVARAEAFVREAAAARADLVALPELFSLLAPADAMRAGAEALAGPTITWARDLAAELGIVLLAGSIAMRLERSDHIANTSCLVDETGEVVATYQKIHLFDNEVPGAAFRESASVAPGNEIVCADAARTRLGLSVCYDVRFPELYRALARDGARLIALPSAFTAATGKPHWHTLVRARAIENGVFVLAPNQTGATGVGIEMFGHSLVVDPWGEVLAEAGESECVITADIDIADVERVRARLPSLANRRPDVYG